MRATAPANRTVEAALATMPDGWAKKRLILDGPTESGTDAVRMTVLALAAEFRCSGVSESDALAYVTANLERFSTGRTAGSALLRQLRRSVALAYHPPSGEPILSGCCRSPQPTTKNGGTGALRRTFEPYCDEECARVCPMLRAIRNPERSLYATEYEALDRSNLWNRGAGLGEAGHLAFQLIALLALASGQREIRASQRFLCMKSEGRFSRSAFGKVLARLNDLGIVTLLDRKSALRQIEPWSPERVDQLEAALGVAGKRNANIREARTESDNYLSWLHDELSSRGFDDALADWDPPLDEPERVGPREGDGRPSTWGSVPRHRENWGGSIRPRYERPAIAA